MDEEILQRISLHDDYFCNMVNLIPGDIYFPNEDVDEEQLIANKFKKAPSKVDVAQRKEKEAVNKVLKKEKFDPENQKSNVEKITAKMNGDGDDSSDEEDDEMEGDEEEDEDEEEEAEEDEEEEEEEDGDEDDDEEEDDDDEEEGEGAPKKNAMQALRDRLNKRIVDCREGRKVDVGGTTNKTNKRKKMMKVHKKENAKKQKVDDGKAAKKEAAKKAKAAKKEAAAADADGAEKRKAGDAGDAARATKKSATGDDAVDVGNLQFSGVLLEGDKTGHRAIVKKGQGVHNLIRKAESNQRRIEQLKQSEAGKAELQQMEMERAIRVASGENIKDDLTMLKKAAKRQESKKKKSSRAWKDREKQVEDHKDAKQKKRSDNLTNSRSRGKKDAEKMVKTVHNTAAGQVDTVGHKMQRPGFEGKSSGFLNKKS
jgi:hypothetical protein